MFFSRKSPSDCTVVGRLRQRDRTPKLSRSKFVKQAGSDSVDSLPKAEPQEQRGLFLHTILSRLQIWGYSLSHTWSHTISLAILTSGVRWLFSGLIPDVQYFCFTGALIVFHYLPSPSLPATFPPLILGPTSGSKSIILIYGFIFPQHHYINSCLSFFLQWIP
jgi:hypothetical protein